MTRILFYLICAVILVFIYRVRIKENECAFFSISISTFLAEKSAIFRIVFVQNWEEIESLKNEKRPGIVLEKSSNSVFRFLYEPCCLIIIDT